MDVGNDGFRSLAHGEAAGKAGCYSCGRPVWVVLEELVGDGVPWPGEDQELDGGLVEGVVEYNVLIRKEPRASDRALRKTALGRQAGRVCTGQEGR